MVATPDTTARIEADLRALETELAFVPEAAANWFRWNEYEREQFRYQWEIELTDLLLSLTAARDAGNLSPVQAKRLAAIFPCLESLSESFRVMSIHRPAITPAA